MSNYKVGDRILLVNDESLFELNGLPHDLLGKVEVITDIIRYPDTTIYPEGIMYIITNNRWNVSSRQIEGYAKIDNWKEVIDNGKE